MMQRDNDAPVTLVRYRGHLKVYDGGGYDASDPKEWAGAVVASFEAWGGLLPGYAEFMRTVPQLAAAAGAVEVAGAAVRAAAAVLRQAVPSGPPVHRAG